MDPKLTGEEQVHVKSIKSKIQRVRQKSSEEVYGSEDYWISIKFVLDGQEEISSIRFRALQRGSNITDPGFKQAAQKYMSQQRRRSAKRLSILEREYLREKQRDFSKDVLKAYGGITRIGKEPHCFSVLDGTRRDQDDFVAAHIFPLFLGPRIIEYIFGPDARYEIESPRNTLLLPRKLKKHFDAHGIVIVPAHSDNPEVREWKFLVIDKSVLWSRYVLSGGPMEFSDLHRQKLNFPNNFCPRARYLYFHYLTSMIIHFGATKGTSVVRSELPDAEWPELTKAWATHGPYLRDSMIYSFIEEMGHDLPEELKENALTHCVSIRSNNEAEEVEEVVASLGMIRMDSEDEDESEDDDDNEDGDDDAVSSK